MSLLDILCGALGAFCFLMLALFPDHIKASNAGADRANGNAGGKDGGRCKREEEAREAKKRAEEAEKGAQGEGRAEPRVLPGRVERTAGHGSVVKAPGKVVLPKKAIVPKDQFSAEIGDIARGPAKEEAWLPTSRIPATLRAAREAPVGERRRARGGSRLLRGPRRNRRQHQQHGL